MTQINKTQETSEIGRKTIEDWLHSTYGQNEDGQNIINKDRLLSKVRIMEEECEGSNKTVHGRDIWRLMRDKKELKQSLLREQGFVCCYCGRRIFNDHNTQIEHLEPKHLFKNRNKIYDYDNLMASCYGSSQDVIHIVKENQTVEELAKNYGISKWSITEFFVDKRKYEEIVAKNEEGGIHIKVGDKIVIVKCISDKNQQHCGPRKDSVEISFHPLIEDCEKFVFYINKNDDEVLVKSEHYQSDIDKLGLNDNDLLNRQRKSIIQEALTLRNKIIKSDDRRELIRLQLTAFEPNEGNTFQGENEEDAQFYRKPFWFIQKAVFTGHYKL